MGIDVSKLAERLSQLNTPRSSGSSLNFFSIKDGRNVARILPPSNKDNFFFEEVWVHYGVGKSDSDKKGQTVICPTTAGDNKPCPVCELVKELYSLSKKKDDTYSKQARDLGRKKRVYMNAIDRSDDLSKFKKNDEGKWINTETDKQESPIKVLAVGITVLKQLLGIITDPEYGDITDPEEGLDVIITKSGSGQMNTEYDTKTVRKNSPIGFDDWKDNLNDLSQLSKAKSYEDIAALLTGEKAKESEESEDDEEDTKESKEVAKGADDEEALQAEIQAALARRKK